MVRYLLLLVLVGALLSQNHALYADSEPVILDLPISSNIPTVDPALATDRQSMTVIQNHYIGLTDIDPHTGELKPELATSWEVSTDGLIWTFALREDVWWVRYDPATTSFEQIRPITAEDVVYSIKRACDSRIGNYYSGIIALVIAGCDVVYGTVPEEVTDDLVWGDTIKVSSPSANQITIELQQPAAYFLSMTTLPIFNPVYPETASELGTRWAETGWLVTSGAYALHKVQPAVRYEFVRNLSLPSDLSYGGNIEQINFTLIEDLETHYALYQDLAIDLSGVPIANLPAAPVEQLHSTTDNTVFYFGFNQGQPPFDNVHVRRAFSAIIDRGEFISLFRPDRAYPMLHLTPPYTLHAPPIDEIGVGFDPEYAREQMALAGYPNCEGLPNIHLEVYQGAGAWVEFWAYAAETYLGCSPDLFTVEILEFSISMPDINVPVPPETPPNASTFGWGEDYPDAHNWLNDALDSSHRDLVIQISEENQLLILEAAHELDPERRIQRYREIEEQLFGLEGEFPIAPLFMRTTPIVVQPWFTGPFERDWASNWGTHWDAYQLDRAAKEVAQTLEEN